MAGKVEVRLSEFCLPHVQAHTSSRMITSIIFPILREGSNVELEVFISTAKED